MSSSLLQESSQPQNDTPYLLARSARPSPTNPPPPSLPSSHFLVHFDKRATAFNWYIHLNANSFGPSLYNHHNNGLKMMPLMVSRWLCALSLFECAKWSVSVPLDDAVKTHVCDRWLRVYIQCLLHLNVIQFSTTQSLRFVAIKSVVKWI